jgi:hypothetical protein
MNVEAVNLVGYFLNFKQSYSLDPLCMKVNVLFHEGGDEVIAVVVAIVHPQGHLATSRLLQVLG